MMNFSYPFFGKVLHQMYTDIFMRNWEYLCLCSPDCLVQYINPHCPEEMIVHDILEPKSSAQIQQ